MFAKPNQTHIFLDIAKNLVLKNLITLLIMLFVQIYAREYSNKKQNLQIDDI